MFMRKDEDGWAMIDWMVFGSQMMYPEPTTRLGRIRSSQDQILIRLHMIRMEIRWPQTDGYQCLKINRMTSEGEIACHGHSSWPCIYGLSMDRVWIQSDMFRIMIVRVAKSMTENNLTNPLYKTSINQFYKTPTYGGNLLFQLWVWGSRNLWQGFVH